MRKMTGTLVVLLLTLCLQAQDSGSPGQKQSSFTDSLWLVYQSSRGENLALYKGRQIMSGYTGINGHAFYPYQDWAVGKVQYEGFWYDGVEVMYDIYRDEVLVRHPNGVPLTLFGDRVQAFSIKDHRFVKFDSSAGPIRPGFYEVLADGELKVYARRIVVLREEIVEQTVVRTFNSTHRYYAQLGNKVITVNKQRPLVDLAKAKKSEVLSAVKASGLRFRKDAETVIKIIADTYNQPKQ